MHNAFGETSKRGFCERHYKEFQDYLQDELLK